MIKNGISSLMLVLTLFSALTAFGQTSTDEVTAPVSSDTLCHFSCSDAFYSVDHYCFYTISAVMNAGDSELAPYYISSNNGGAITQQYSALIYADIAKYWDKSKRFSWTAGLNAAGGYASSAGYER